MSSGWPMRMICRSFSRGGLEVGEEADLLEHVRGEVLSLVDDQYGAVAAPVRVEQVVVERVDVHLPAGGAGRIGNAKLVADGGQKLDVRELRVEDQRHVHPGGQLLEQAPAQRRLPGSHLAGELDEAAAFPDPVEQMGEGLAMGLAHVQVAGIGRDRERGLSEAEMTFVHQA